MSETTVRYALYLERTQEEFLGDPNTLETSVLEMFNSAYQQCPSFSVISPELVYLGEGYKYEDFPNLATMFGKFMAGLDVEDVLSTLFEKRVVAYETQFKDALAIEETIYLGALRKVMAEYREINSVLSSSFLISKAKVYLEYIHKLSQKITRIVTKELDESVKVYATYLNWQMAVIKHHSIFCKDNLLSKMRFDTYTAKMLVREREWVLRMFTDYLNPALDIRGMSNVGGSAVPVIPNFVLTSLMTAGYIVYSLLTAGLVVSSTMIITTVVTASSVTIGAGGTVIIGKGGALIIGAGPPGWIVAAVIIVVVVAVYFIIEGWDSIEDFFSDIGDSVEDFVDDIGHSIGDVFGW